MKKIVGVLLVVILSFFAIRSLMGPGYFPMHDDTQPSRIYEMKKSLSEGQLPVRWVPDLGYGYGYPIFNFYAPLSYYIGAGISFAGVDVITATKIAFMLSIVVAGIGMFLLSEELFGMIGGVVASVAYIYAPYHALDLYVRGDLAELWAYAFIPYIFYASWKIINNGKWTSLVIGSLSFSALILSHNLTALMISGFYTVFLLVVFWASYKRKRIKVVKKLIVMMIIGILIASFYWIPVFGEMRYTNVLSQIGGGADFKDHFVCIHQLWSSPWGFGGSIPGCADGMSFRMGKIHILLSVIAIFLSLFMLLRKIVDTQYVLNPKGIFFIFSSLGFVLSLFLASSFALPVWNFIKGMEYFQYPWRFLLASSFFSSVLCGFSIWLIGRSINVEYRVYYLPVIIGGIIVGAIIYSSYSLFFPQIINNKSVQDYTSNTALQWTISKISDEYMPRHFNKPQQHRDIPDAVFDNNSQVVFFNTNKQITAISSSVNVLASQEDIRIRTAYFPSWKLYVDNKRQNYTIYDKGIMVKIPHGIHALDLYFEQTPLEVFSNIVSLVGFCALFVGIISPVRRKMYE